MHTDTAITLIDNLVFKPGWSFAASDHTSRFEGTICVRITQQTVRSEREDAPLGYPTKIDPYADFPIVVGSMNCDEDLYFALLDCIARFDSHEAREFLRVKGTYWSPFHPHTQEGMARWAERCGTPVHLDLGYGVV